MESLGSCGRSIFPLILPFRSVKGLAWLLGSFTGSFWMRAPSSRLITAQQLASYGVLGGISAHVPFQECMSMYCCRIAGATCQCVAESRASICRGVSIVVGLSRFELNCPCASVIRQNLLAAGRVLFKQNISTRPYKDARIFYST